MSITVSDIQAVSPAWPDATHGRVGWVSYKVTLGDGRYAWTGAWFNGAYSVAPGDAADQSARGTDASGLYTGLGTLDVAAWDVSVWSDPPNGLDTSGDVTTPTTFTPGLDSDGPAVAEVATAAADTGVLAAIGSAMTDQGVSNYAVGINLTCPTTGLRFGSDSASATLTGSDPLTDPHATLTSSPSWASSDTSVVSVAVDDDYHVTLSFHNAGTAVVTVSVGSPAASPFLAASQAITVS